MDLHPLNAYQSMATCADDSQEGGYAQSQSYFISASHAYCWHGSAARGVDLHTT